METSVTFRHFNAQHPNLHDIALESLKKLEKFHDNIISGDVFYHNEKEKFVEIKIHIPNKTLVVKEENEEFKKAIHDATEKMIRQIKKQKTKQDSVR